MPSTSAAAAPSEPLGLDDPTADGSSSSSDQPPPPPPPPCTPPSITVSCRMPLNETLSNRAFPSSSVQPPQTDETTLPASRSSNSLAVSQSRGGEGDRRQHLDEAKSANGRSFSRLQPPRTCGDPLPYVPPGCPPSQPKGWKFAFQQPHFQAPLIARQEPPSQERLNQLCAKFAI